MKPPALKPGDLIGVMAPSSTVNKKDIEASAAALEARGYKVYIHPQTYAAHHQSAGTSAEKLAALHELWARDDIKAIWCAGGGNRALYLTPDLDFKLMQSKPKILIGFSDITSILNPIYAQTGSIGIHGQVFKHLHEFTQLDETLAMLAGNVNEMDLSPAEIWQDGTASGILIGGCLSLFHYLPGTPDCPDLNGALLFLEDTGDHLSRFDRMLAQMKRMGVFERIGGLILGEFTDLHEGARPFGFSLKECVMECVGERNIPVVCGAPFGHGKNLLPLPVGGKARLDTGAKTLKLTESPFTES